MGQDPRGGQPPSSRRKENFKEWYPWIVQAAGLVDKRYPVRGLDVKLPYGLKALRLIEARFRDEMEATEHDEIEVPSLVPRDFQIVSSKLVARLKFAREKDADFSELRADDEDGDLAKEVFWVRQGGEAEEADLPSCFLRPSSELALCALLLLYIRAHSDLPFKVFQLSNTFRVETKPRHTFLRARELSLYESHACQRSEEAATAQVEETLALASRIFSDLALPYLEVKRPSWDAAPGAWYTVAIDVIMPGGRTHQAASCHHYLDHWAKSFGIRFESEEGGRAHVHQTALAMSERVLGCVIAIHGDDRGAIFPPKVAPIQVIVVPIVVNTGKAAGTRD